MLFAVLATVTRAEELVYLDPAGVVRWVAGDREVALFGANYTLPSASDYRAAGYLGVDRKKLVEQDMAHFARLGWDGLRVALWGDWENSDRDGNLIENDHLDLMHWLVHQAKQRGIYMLLTPIHTHSSLWPDGVDGEHIQGFSKHFPRDQMGRDPAAIAAQRNYLRQFLEHVNPYTGVAMKDEPAILFVELINEPWHHSSDFAGSVAYIDALADAVRSTGCDKLLFHNLSQDFGMAAPIRASKADGFSFGWYPTGLVARRTLPGNFLRWVDDYPPLDDPRLAGMPSLVYEFDAADSLSPTMYPAMVRTFRGAGAQFATMFAYDMLATAPYNLGWQTHLLNLVYSPRKAVGAVIAAEAMRRLPRGVRYGVYPENRYFGPFHLDPERDLATMETPEVFMHTGDAPGRPVETERLERIVGVGSSAVVDYEGSGAWFLDRLGDGVWRLEVYPDVVQVMDPFAQRLEREKVSMRLIERDWPMRVRVPDLGETFSVEPLNAGNEHRATAGGGVFEVRPGVYLLRRYGIEEPSPLPERVGRVGVREFVCPPMPELPVQVVERTPPAGKAGASLSWAVEVAHARIPDRVVLHRTAEDGSALAPVEMQRERGYRWAVEAELPAGATEWGVEIENDGVSVRFPAATEGRWQVYGTGPESPLVLFDAERDADLVFFPRVPESLRAFAPRMTGKDEGGRASLRLHGIAPTQSERSEVRVGVDTVERIGGMGTHAEDATGIRLDATASAGGAALTLVLLEADGTSWQADVRPSSRGEAIDLRWEDFAPGGGEKLPVGYPGNWNRALPLPPGRGGAGDRPRPSRVEQAQCVIRPSLDGREVDVDLARIVLLFGENGSR
ncbi:hypothetical protein ASA1KI_20420 [Opitutales bacterium ASA1]|nr:hypothetical protein ASA1KI_20420 [Opitutales bacterium ASA1]